MRYFESDFFKDVSEETEITFENFHNFQKVTTVTISCRMNYGGDQVFLGHTLEVPIQLKNSELEKLTLLNLIELRKKILKDLFVSGAMNSEDAKEEIKRLDRVAKINFGNKEK